MKLEIIGKKTRRIVSPSNNSTLTHAAMGEHVLSLSFTLDEKVDFDINDFVEFDGKVYTLLEIPWPTMKSTQEWVYDLKFHGVESELKRALVLNEKEAVFALTAPAVDHIKLIAKNINRIKNIKENTTGSWRPGNVIAKSNPVVISYNGTSCYDALTQLANQLETEWWIEGTAIHLNECKYEIDPIELGYQDGLISLSRNTNDNAKFFTRLYPIGTTRNINPEAYNKETNPTGYGFKRLQLPAANGNDWEKRPQSVDKNTQYGIIEHFEEAAFSHIYPHRVGKISSWREEKRTDEDKTFLVYYFKDTEPDFTFDPNDYEIPGLVKHIVFQNAKHLSGYDFEVNFDSKEREFEIITQYPDGFQQLPGGSLLPAEGDEYILYNIYMPRSYYEEAEKEFQKAVEDYLDKYSKDKSIYQGETDYIEIEKRQLRLKIGLPVRLKSTELFPTGFHDSRITSISQNVNIPGKMTLSFSDAVAKGTIESIRQEISDAMNFAQTNHILDIIRSWEYNEPTDLNVYSALKSEKEFLLKGKNDTAKGFYKFLQGMELGLYEEGNSGTLIDKAGNTETGNIRIRNEAETTKLQVSELADIKKAEISELKVWKLADMEKAEATNLEVRELAKMEQGEATNLLVSELADIKKAEISELKVWKLADMEKAEATNLEVRELAKMEQGEATNLLVSNLARIFQATVGIIGSEKFVDGFTGSGWKIWNDNKETQDYKLEIDRLSVRKTMTVFELLIQKVRSVGGELIVSAGNGKIEEVELIGDNYKITLEEINTFCEHDLVRCQVWTGSNVKYYWVEVAGIEDKSIIVPASEFTDFYPEPGDEIVLMGNTQNPNRQNLISISASETGQPRIDILDNVNKKDFEGKLRVRLGDLSGITDIQLNPKGYGLYSDNAYLRGEFRLTTGEDIKTRFEATEGMIRSQIEGVRKDVSSYQSYLHNAYFGEDLNGWQTQDDSTFFLAGDDFIALEDSALLTNGNNFVRIRKDIDRTVLCIHNSHILQGNKNFETHPVFTERDPETGALLPKTFYVEFLYKCIQPGTLKIEFPGAKSNGFTSFEILKVKPEKAYIDVTDDYRTFEVSGLWNGSGSFKLSFTGEIYLYAIRLAEDRIGDMEQKYIYMNSELTQTVEELTSLKEKVGENAEHREYMSGIVQQTADFLDIIYSKKIDGKPTKQSYMRLTNDSMNFSILDQKKAAALRFHSDSFGIAFGKMTSGSSPVFSTLSELILDPQSLKIATYENNILKSEVKILTDQVQINASQIGLNGAVVINDHIKMDKDGKLHALGANIQGHIEAESGTFKGTFKSSTDGNKILIQPEKDSASIFLESEQGYTVGQFGFFTEEGSGGGTAQGRVDLWTYYAAPQELAGVIRSNLSLSAQYIMLSGSSNSEFGKISLSIKPDNKASVLIKDLPSYSKEIDSKTLPSGSLYRVGSNLKIVP